MQTHFTQEQLRDPATATANTVLRACVHCGLCTATCPTFLLVGDELDSPRGRIYLIKDMLERAIPAPREVVHHIDRCLSCFACMSTCPSGVHYRHLIDHARAYIERTHTRALADRALRGLLARVLPDPRLFRLALRAATLARPLARPLARLLPPTGGQTASRLRAMLALAPARLPPVDRRQAPQVHRAQGIRRGRVALLAGCAQTVLDPEINAASIRLLTRLGLEVVLARGAGCCGALTHHLGHEQRALAAARATIAAWSAEIAGQGLDAILINTSGCGTTVKEYGHLFRAEPEPWPAQAQAVAERAQDITEYLDAIGFTPNPDPGPDPHRTPVPPVPGLRVPGLQVPGLRVPGLQVPNLRVAYHAACSLQHGQRVLTAPKALLGRAGFTVVEPREAHLCCGSAGTYNLLQPELAGQLRARKLGHLAATAPDVIATGNIGCMTQLAGGGIPVVHTIQLLDWQDGGPRPSSLPL